MDLYSIICPTYNERDNIPLIIYLLDKVFKKEGLRYEIIIVDDNSPDGTADVVRKLQKLFGEDTIKLLCRAGKLGLGSAYKAGLGLTKGKFVFLMDADLSHHPKFIPAMIKTMHETNADIVSGNRYCRGGGVHGWNLRRKLTSRVANFLAHTLLSPPIDDLTGSFRIYKRDKLEEVMKHVRSSGYVFQMEIIARSHQLGYRIKDIPITFVDRIFGESKLGANEIVQYLKGLMQIFLSI